MCSLALKCATGFIAFFMSGVTAFCQSDALALSSGAASPGGAVSLNLSLSSASGSQPAGVEWTLAYSPSNIVSISASAGAAATAAGKSLSCTGSSGSYMCFLTGLSPGGLNANPIENGVIAVVTATLSATSSGATINVTNALSTSAAGSAVQTTAAGGTIAAIVPLSLTSLNCNPGSVTSGASTTCAVTVNQAASATTAVALSSTNSLITIPATVTVPAGASSATFTAAAGTTITKVTVTLTATLDGASDGASQTTSLFLLPTPAVSSLSCNPTSLASGSSAACTVTLSRKIYALRKVQLNVNSSLLTIPTSLSVAAGTASATFTATAGAVTASQSVTITASMNTAGLNSSVTTTLNLGPALPSALSCDPTSLTAGSSSTCTLTLTSPAPTGGVTVAVSSDSPALTVPPSVDIPASASTATFAATAATGSPSGQSTVAVSASLYGVSQSASFSVTICPCSVLSLSAQPANPDTNDNQAIELGMQFTSSVSGYVTGVRFFKSLNNTGTHVGRLWNTKGKLLAGVTFTDETPSGWQAAYFPSPVAVKPHTTYVISYNAPNGNYAADSGSFTNALSSPPLVALADGANGPNGVYQYGSGQFPTTGAAATNFWVDMVFNTSSTIGTAAPVSLWTPQAIPNTPAAPTTQAAQLGLTFIPNVAGYVTGLRFYKSSSNLGQHIGYLWSSTGTQLASVTFTGESASGWQQANLATPVAITANTPYVVSYWAPQGYYADDAGYFATAGLTNQLLYAPPDGQYGPNGSYAGGKTFPASSSDASNYWVDVVFTTAIQ